jgi:hypothetical protein
MRRIFPPPSDALKIAGLLEREQALEEKTRRLEPKQRAEIEAELAEIRRLLEACGFRRSA